MKETKRPAVDEPPLRYAGMSLEGQLDDVLMEKVLPLFVVTIGFCCAGGGVVIAQLIGTGWAYFAFGFGAIAMAIIFGIATFRAYKKAKNLRHGLAGERIVGQLLEELRADGCFVFHDICETDYNIDHVVVGPQGIFAIETKARSRPPKMKGKKATIDYHGDHVMIDGMGPYSDSLDQARASADRVRQILTDSTGRRDIFVRPVVTYPGWWVELRKPLADVWVLNPRAISGFLRNAPHVLSNEDVNLYKDRLTIHILDGQKKRLEKAGRMRDGMYIP